MKIKKTFFLLSLVGTLVGGCSKEEISGLSSIGFPKSNEIYYSTSDGNYLDLESYDWYKNSIKSHKRVNDSIFILNFIQDINKIEKMFFYGCSSLTGITIPNSVKEIESEAFNGCRSLKNFTIPEGVTTINRSTFAGCSSLTNITIPNSVKEIGGGAFGGCSSLTSITIPNSVKEIGNGAFNDCSSLKNITIPEGVRKQFQRLSVGFKVYGVNRETLPKIQLAYPESVAEQSKIAEILMKWDEAIELQEKQIHQAPTYHNR